MNRREALRTLAAGSAAGALAAGAVVATAPSAEASVADPALAALTTYRQQLAAFDASPSMDDAEANALRDSTWGPLYYAASSNPTAIPAATSQAGAVLALQTVLAERNLDGFDEGLVRSALAFLEGRA